MDSERMKLAIEHTDWTSEFFRWVYMQAFLHGYKHGKEAKPKEAKKAKPAVK